MRWRREECVWVKRNDEGEKAVKEREKEVGDRDEKMKQGVQPGPK